MSAQKLEWLTHEDVAAIQTEVAQRRNALRQLILGGDHDAVKACVTNWGDDYASDFVRDVIGQIGHDEPSRETAEIRYWLIRRAAEKWLTGYLEDAITSDDVEKSLREEGALL